MCKNQQCAADLERRRNIPALAKEKEITPKAPRSELGSDQKRGTGDDIEPEAKQYSNRLLWARAISDLIVSGSCTLVWVANFDDTVLGFIRGNFVNVYFDNPGGSGTQFA